MPLLLPPPPLPIPIPSPPPIPAPLTLRICFCEMVYGCKSLYEKEDNVREIKQWGWKIGKAGNYHIRFPGVVSVPR